MDACGSICHAQRQFLHFCMQAPNPSPPQCPLHNSIYCIIIIDDELNRFAKRLFIQ